MSIKLLICDFDGTITRFDLLDRLCGLCGRMDESRQINEDYIAGQIDGETALKRRFGLIEGLELDRVHSELFSNVELNDGAEELIKFAKDNGVHTLVVSGNATFVLDYFGRRLGFDDFLGSDIAVVDGRIAGPQDDDSCRIDKVRAVREYMSSHKLTAENVVAVGDAVTDAPVFRLAGRSFIIGDRPAPPGAQRIRSLAEVADHIGRVNRCASEAIRIPRIVFNFADCRHNDCPFCFIPFDGKGVGDPKLWLSIFERINALSPELLSFSGCDPLYYPEFSDFLIDAPKKSQWGMDSSLIHLDRRRFEALHGRLDLISTSWDDATAMPARQRYTKELLAKFMDNLDFVTRLMPQLIIHTLYSSRNADYLTDIADCIISKGITHWSLYQYWPFDFVCGADDFISDNDLFMRAGRRLAEYCADRIDFEYVPFENRANGYFFVTSLGGVYTTVGGTTGRYQPLGTIFDDDIAEKWYRSSNPGKALEILNKKLNREKV